MRLPGLTELEQAAQVVYAHMLPSPQLEWPLLSEHCGCEVWVKHENHNPTGAFKVRGGLVYLQDLKQRDPSLQGVVAATRGNHGQSIAFAAGRLGLRTVVVVPEGNNPEKNAAMRALGAELIIHGRDFDAAIPRAREVATARGYTMVPSFHPALVRGVGTYALEFLRQCPDLARVYVPIGLGSGICGVVSARDALGLDTEIVGVVSSLADCYQRSFEQGACISTDSADTLADGLAVRVPNPDALEVIRAGVARIIAVDDDAVLQAMRQLFQDCHNVAEGAGAAALAALCAERRLNRGARVGIVLSGGNADRETFLKALSG